MKNLGYANGWPTVMFDKDGNETKDRKLAFTFGDKEPDELIKCKELGHKSEVICDTNRGDHQRQCSICQIKWGWDSGD